MPQNQQGPITQRARRLYKQAERALLSGRIDEAQEKGERLLRDCPQFSNAWFLLSLTYQHLGREPEALVLIDRALALSPGSVHFIAQRSALLLRVGDNKQALTEAVSAAKQELNDTWSLDTVGVVLSTLDEHSQALPLFKKACKQQPDNPQFLYNLASAERVCGLLTQAAEHLQEAIRLKPGFAKARWSLSTLSKATESENHQSSLEQLLRNEQLPAMDRCYLLYALAKEFEDRKNWEKASPLYQQGADLRRKLLPYNRENTEALFNALQQQFTHEGLPSSWDKGYMSEEPIFIVGMPRTGTTLVERILSAHSDVYAAGELRQFPMSVTAMLDNNPDRINPDVILSPEQIAQSESLDFKALGKAYIDSTRPRTGNTLHFIDKLPLNFLYLGLIARALPKARFIHVVRNPMDTCWSNFKQLFGAIYPYSYDLEDTAHFYLQYRQLMAHWHRQLPGRILDLSYEQLIEHQETETRRLLDFCTLPWQNQCMNFHNNPDAVATASSVQVRQSLYSGSIGRWRAFRPQMKAAEQILNEAGLDIESKDSVNSLASGQLITFPQRPSPEIP